MAQIFFLQKVEENSRVSLFNINKKSATTTTATTKT